MFPVRKVHEIKRHPFYKGESVSHSSLWLLQMLRDVEAAGSNPVTSIFTKKRHMEAFQKIFVCVT